VSVGISNYFFTLVQISCNISENLHLARMFKDSFTLVVNGCITVMENASRLLRHGTNLRNLNLIH